MDTKGHGKIAEEVGFPSLVQAFNSINQRRIPLNAFHLGNWITDVQQLVDPLETTADSVKEKLLPIADWIINTIIAYPLPGGRRITHGVARMLQEKKQELEAFIDHLFRSTGPGPRRNVLFDTVLIGFRVFGYFKFVHPIERRLRREHEPLNGPRMNFDIYLQIFNDSDLGFRQYYPHEHLDRPEIRPSSDTESYRSEIAQGPLSEEGTASRLFPDMYEYMREDILIAAGLLAEVEKDWAQRMFDLGHSPQINDINWHKSLAKLGKALHLVEDFFSHSNFIEHATTRLGGAFIPTTRTAREIFRLRLKRWQPGIQSDTNTSSLPDEPHIVTGFFAEEDMMISFLHFLETFFGVRFIDPEITFEQARRSLSDIILERNRLERTEFQIQQLFYEMGEILENPEAAMLDSDNRTAQLINRQLPYIFNQGITRETVGLLLEELPLFQSLPPQIKTDIFEAVILLNTVYQIRGLGVKLYTLIKNLWRFYRDPYETIFKWIGDYAGELIANQIKNAIGYYASDRIYQLLGHRRIGSHSLLAKDWETDNDPMYKRAWNCAAGLHWHIMSVLIRQNHYVAPPSGTSSPTFVDWLELLEFFLRHPFGGTQIRLVSQRICINIVHIVDNVNRADTLENLARFFRSSACSRNFTWKTIADANFGTTNLNNSDTQRVVNRVLRITNTGYLVRDGINYAFRPGVTVIIPFQTRIINISQNIPTDTSWWRAVLKRVLEDEDAAWQVFPGGYLDFDTHESAPPLDTGHIPVKVSLSFAAGRISNARVLRLQRERAYQ